MPRNRKIVDKPEQTDKQRLSALYAVSQKMKGFRPAKEVLTKIRSHPTIFPLYDRATGIGGHPLERVVLIHGPSGHGKTAFVHGLGLSFLHAHNFYAFVDAEYTTPEDWLQTLMSGYSEHPGFIASRPNSYEETVDSVRSVVTNIADARKRGDIPEETTGLIVIDSLKKLVPVNLMKNLLKGAESADGSIDGARGRGAMMKAALNAQWLDELIPLLYHTKCTLVFIARETESAIDLRKPSEPGDGMGYKVTGGKSLIYESSMVGRITHTWVKEGSGDSSRVVGERHRISITKTKVSGKTAKVENGYFHTSNGLLVPQGFDRARDVLELALDSGHVKQTGAWYQCDTLNCKWQGISKAVVALSQDQVMLDTLEGEAR